MSCQCRDFPQSYVVIPLAIATRNFFHNLFYCLDLCFLLKLIFYASIPYRDYGSSSLHKIENLHTLAALVRQKQTHKYIQSGLKYFRNTATEFEDYPTVWSTDHLFSVYNNLDFCQYMSLHSVCVVPFCHAAVHTIHTSWTYLLLCPISFADSRRHCLSERHAWIPYELFIFSIVNEFMCRGTSSSI